MENRLSSYKINIWQTLIFITLLPSFLPTYLWRFSEIGIVCKLIRFITFGIMIAIYFFGFHKPSKILILILFFLISRGISTYLSPTGDLNAYLSTTISTITTCLVVDWGLKHRLKSFIKAILFMFECWIVINLFTIILFPYGLYESGIYSTNYFLGYDNTHIRLQIPAICISYIYSFLINKKISKRTIFLFVVVLISNLLVFSATAIVATLVCGLGLVYIIVREKNGINRGFKLFSIKNAVLISIIGTIFLVGMSAQSSFSFLIEKVLKKDMTLSGRTYIWENALNAIYESPIWGWGYEPADITSMRLVKQIGFGTSPHNFYLEVLYQGGVVLFIITMLIYLILYRKHKKYMKSSVVYIIGLWFTITSVMGLTEPQLGTNLILSWFIAYYIDNILDIKKNKKNIYEKK